MDVPPLTPEMLAEFPPAAVELIRQFFEVIEAQSAIMAQQTPKITELDARLNLNSRNSSKPRRATGRRSSRLPRNPSPARSRAARRDISDNPDRPM